MATISAVPTTASISAAASTVTAWCWAPDRDTTDSSAVRVSTRGLMSTTPPGNRESAEEPEHLIGLAAEHAAADDVDPARCVEHHRPAAGTACASVTDDGEPFFGQPEVRGERGAHDIHRGLSARSRAGTPQPGPRGTILPVGHGPPAGCGLPHERRLGLVEDEVEDVEVVRQQSGGDGALVGHRPDPRGIHDELGLRQLGLDDGLVPWEGAEIRLSRGSVEVRDRLPPDGGGG